jgi:outer membrane receptor protein involved in Fe transport
MKHQRLAEDDWETDEQKPAVVVGGGVSLYLGHFDLSVYGKYVSEYESSRFAANLDGVPGADTVSIGDYSTLDINGGYTYTAPGGQVFHVYLAVANVTDERYSTVVGYPDFGRRFTLGLRYSY